jgi:hypothetical protein
LSGEAVESKNMKSKFQSFWRSNMAAFAVAIGAVIFGGLPADAQNPVVNGNFENPIVFGGTTNWEVVYVGSCAGDFAVKSRITEARHGTTGYGAGFKPQNEGLMHAYLKQTVSDLTPNGVYAITNWMCFPGDPGDAWHPKVHIYMETVGVGNVRTADVINNVYQQFVLTNTATASGEIEIRLHFKKDGFTTGTPPKWTYMHSWFDDVSMGLVSAPIVTNPPYRILSFTLAGQAATWTWESVSNQLYSIQTSPDLSSWSTFQAGLLATGTNLTFNTNVSLSSPQFFRIHQP